MASDLEFVEFVCGQMQDAGAISYRKMFGEYAVYCEGKVVALICDNRLFVKPTASGRAFIGEAVEAPPYPGARPSLLVEEQIEDREWLSELVRRTERELPAPRPRAKRKSSRKKS
jgi:TfoX/Sxy family transcriptional regulator of competence genes